MSEKFKALSFTAKIQYIWEFYKLRIATVAAVLALIIVLISRWVTAPETVLYCLVFNDLNNEKIQEHIQEGYAEYKKCDPKDVSVDIGYHFRMSEEKGRNHIDEGSSIRFLKAQSMNQMDVIITDYNSMLWVKSEDFLFDVKEVLPKELYEKLEPYFVYAVFKDSEDQEKGDGIVYGLDISQTEFYKGYTDNYEDGIIAFPNCSKNVEAAIDFVKYVYGIKY